MCNAQHSPDNSTKSFSQTYTANKSGEILFILGAVSPNGYDISCGNASLVRDASLAFRGLKIFRQNMIAGQSITMRVSVGGVYNTAFFVVIG